MIETGKWYEKSGNCGDVVCSTRVRLARNLKQFPFPAKATDPQREAVEQKADALLSGNSILFLRSSVLCRWKTLQKRRRFPWWNATSSARSLSRPPRESRVDL